MNIDDDNKKKSSWSSWLGIKSANKDNNHYDDNNSVSNTGSGNYSINTKNTSEIYRLEKERDTLRKQLKTADYGMRGNIFQKIHDLNKEIEELNKGNTTYHEYRGGKRRSKRRNSKKTTSKKGKKNRKSNRKSNKKLSKK